MKEKTTLQKYDYYKEVLDKMAAFPVSQNPKLKDMNLSRGVIQAAYKEMYKIDFNGTIIDYLGWINTLYLLEYAKNKVQSKDAWDYIKKIRWDYMDKTDYKNLLRYYMRDIKSFYDWINENCDKGYDFNLFHQLISDDWFRFVRNEIDNQQIERNSRF